MSKEIVSLNPISYFLDIICLTLTRIEFWVSFLRLAKLNP